MLVSDDLSDADSDAFVDLFVSEIGPLYPFSSEITARQFVASHIRSYEPTGFFTLRKRIWKLVGADQEALGFTVASEKLGGSVKFGPTIILPGRRGLGFGRHLRVAVEDIYRTRGMRKAYSTTGAGNGSAIAYVMASGYRIELHLQDHYQRDADELILGKRLLPLIMKERTNQRPASADPEIDRILDDLHLWYADIDQAFVDRFTASLQPDFRQSESEFARKAKKLFLENSGPLAVTVPKRGSCIKLAPLMLSNKDHENAQLIGRIDAYYGPMSRKLYTLWPVERSRDWKMLFELGFVREGLIHSPYRDGFDMFVLSRTKN